ncbi:MAG: TetR/AcrR family transcriptional regulator [bacterium]
MFKGVVPAIMVQILKDEIKDAITAAALKIFLKMGFKKATIAKIAQEADISTGNIYRYFKNKNDLFSSIISPDFVHNLRTLLKSRMEAVSGVSDINTLKKDAAYFKISDELLALCLRNKEKTIILFDRSQGTQYEGFSMETVSMMVELAVKHAKSVNSNFVLTEEKRAVLLLIYKSFLRNIIEILATYEDTDKITSILSNYTAYHLAGLKRYFSG